MVADVNAHGGNVKADVKVHGGDVRVKVMHGGRCKSGD
jgi:hypothetical protein